MQQAPPQPIKTLPPPPPPIKLQEPIKESPRKLFGRKNKAVQAPPPPPPPPPAPVPPPVDQHRNRCSPHPHLLPRPPDCRVQCLLSTHSRSCIGRSIPTDGMLSSDTSASRTGVPRHGGGPWAAGPPASARRGTGAPPLAAWEALPVLCRRASYRCHDPAMRRPSPALCARSWMVPRLPPFQAGGGGIGSCFWWCRLDGCRWL